MTPAQPIALWADELRDISATGLMFTQNIYDREYYQRIRDAYRVWRGDGRAYFDR